MTKADIIIKVLSEDVTLLSRARLADAYETADMIKDMTYEDLVEALIHGGFAASSELDPEDFGSELCKSIMSENETSIIIELDNILPRNE